MVLFSITGQSRVTAWIPAQIQIQIQNNFDCLTVPEGEADNNDRMPVHDAWAAERGKHGRGASWLDEHEDNSAHDEADKAQDCTDGSGVGRNAHLSQQCWLRTAKHDPQWKSASKCSELTHVKADEMLQHIEAGDDYGTQRT